MATTLRKRRKKVVIVIGLPHPRHGVCRHVPTLNLAILTHSFLFFFLFIAIHLAVCVEFFIMSSNPLPNIEVQNLSYKFQDGSDGLQDVGMSLPAGSRTLLIGGEFCQA